MDEVYYWLEEGLLAASRGLAGLTPGARAMGRLTALLPPVSGLARLWGSLDPGRAAGATTTLANPLIRAAARAAAMELAPWPPSVVAGVLRRAERDAVHEAWRPVTDPVLLTELWDGIALAWARHRPAELDSVHRRLHERYGAAPAGDCALWRQTIIAEAARRQALPAESELPPGGFLDWFRKATWGLTEAQRARACLALAAAAWHEAHPEA